MRKKEFSNGYAGGFLIALAILATMAASLFFYQRISAAGFIRAQAGPKPTQPKQRRRPRLPATINPSASSFTHEHHSLPKAKLNCSDCHIIAPSKPGVEAAAAKTEVKSYPYHDKCLSCHRKDDKPHKPQLFRGSTPVICSVCHTGSSPRLTKSDMNPFPKQSAQVILGDLSIKFNHLSTNHKHECQSCHVNVVQLDLAKADVTLATCASSQCHSKQNVQPGFNEEMVDIEDDDFASGKNQHACTGCHSTTIGAKLPPCTHLKLFGTANVTEYYPKSAKLISELCK